MTIDDFHISLTRTALEGLSNEDDALALMILLHTHVIRLREPILDDCPGITELAAITQRHAAAVIAAVWPDRTDSKRTDYAYWYWQFNLRTPYEVVEDIHSDWLRRVERLRDKLCTTEIVNSIEPDD